MALAVRFSQDRANLGAPEMSEPLSDEQLNILVIDDDPDMRSLFVRMLLPEGHQVFVVASAEEGLALLPYDTFQIAFIDQHLPGMEGLVFGEYVRSNNPHMKMALVTGAAEPGMARTAEEHHISVIAKPFKSAQLFAVIDDYKADAHARHLQALQEGPKGVKDLHSAEHFGALPKLFGVPSVPSRIEERVIRQAKRCLAHLKSEARYNERDRFAAFSALITMQVLGVKIPKGPSGQSLTEEFDEIMEARGCKPAFTNSGPSEDLR